MLSKVAYIFILERVFEVINYGVVHINKSSNFGVTIRELLRAWVLQSMKRH